MSTFFYGSLCIIAFCISVAPHLGFTAVRRQVIDTFAVVMFTCIGINAYNLLSGFVTIINDPFNYSYLLSCSI